MTTMTINPEIAYNRLQQILGEGMGKAQSALLAMQDEAASRLDYRVIPSALSFHLNGDVRIGWEGNAESYSLTDHAKGQLFGRVKMHTRYADDLMANNNPRSTELLRHSLTELAAMAPQSRMLVRTVKNVGKAVLSDSYRMMDSGPIFTTFAEQCAAIGMVPYSGSLTETRGFLTFVSPKVHEVAPGEFVVFGVRLGNSDYGRGALELSFFILRVICNNGAVGTDFMRRVHLGKRWGDDAAFLSAKTHDLDTKTVASAVRDMVGGKRFLEEGQRIKGLIEAGSAEIDATRVLESMMRRGRITKAQKEEADTLYNAALPVESLPPNPGTWRLSNVFSLMANAANANTDRHADLQEMAHEVMAAHRN